MSDHTAIADTGGKTGPGVDHSAVLDRGPGPDRDLAVVTAQDGTGPDGGVRTERHGPDDDGLRMDKGLGVDGGDEIAECVERHTNDVTAAIRA